MKIMKKLLAGTLCALSLTMPVCAANGDNDQNDAQNRAIIWLQDNLAGLNHLASMGGERIIQLFSAIEAVDGDEFRIGDSFQLFNALRTYNGETKYEQDGHLNDTITALIREGIDDIDSNISDPLLLDRVVFHNSRYSELPDDIKNQILGKSLIFYVKSRMRIFYDNYNIIRRLLEFHAPTDVLDNKGHTALEIVEIRNNLWGRDGAYSIIANNIGRNLNIWKELKKYDKKVYKLIRRDQVIRRNQDNNCCTIC